MDGLVSFIWLALVACFASSATSAPAVRSQAICEEEQWTPCAASATCPLGWWHNGETTRSTAAREWNFCSIAGESKYKCCKSTKRLACVYPPGVNCAGTALYDGSENQATAVTSINMNLPDIGSAFNFRNGPFSSFPSVCCPSGSTTQVECKASYSFFNTELSMTLSGCDCKKAQVCAMPVQTKPPEPTSAYGEPFQGIPTLVQAGLSIPALGNLNHRIADSGVTLRTSDATNATLTIVVEGSFSSSNTPIALCIEYHSRADTEWNNLPGSDPMSCFTWPGTTSFYSSTGSQLAAAFDPSRAYPYVSIGMWMQDLVNVVDIQGPVSHSVISYRQRTSTSAPVPSPTDAPVASLTNPPATRPTFLPDVNPTTSAGCVASPSTMLALGVAMARMLL